MSDLRKLDAALGRFVEKAEHQNEPLQSMTRTQQYGEFEGHINYALSEQLGSFEYNEDTYQQDINNMPDIGQFIDRDLVISFLFMAFAWGAVSLYQRFGLMPIKSTVSESVKDFNLTDPYHTAQVRDDANFLINRSPIDQTSKDNIIAIVRPGIENGLTPQEIAIQLRQQIPDIVEYRAKAIARTETANAMGDGNLASMKKSGCTHKHWVTAGDNPCAKCIANRDQGDIPIDQPFASGDQSEPCHPNDECYTEPAEIDLSTVDVWLGD